MIDRHLARTKAIDLHLVLDLGQTRTDLGVNIGRRNQNLELVLQSLIEGFCNLHGVRLLPKLAVAALFLSHPKRPL